MGPSAVDTFDYKPELQKRDGQEIDVEVRRHKVKKQKLTGLAKKILPAMENRASGAAMRFPISRSTWISFCVIKALQADLFRTWLRRAANE